MTIDTATSRRTLLTSALGVGGLAALAGAASPAEALTIPTETNSDYLLTLDGIPGSDPSPDDNYPKAIRLETFTFGVTNAVSFSGSTGTARGKAKPMDLVVVARSSKASPNLFKYCCNGKHLKSAQLIAQLRQDGPDPFQYLKVKLEDVLISSYQVTPGEEDGFPLDVVHFTFGKINYTFVRQSNDGSEPTSFTAGFDFVKNVVL